MRAGNRSDQVRRKRRRCWRLVNEVLRHYTIRHASERPGRPQVTDAFRERKARTQLASPTQSPCRPPPVHPRRIPIQFCAFHRASPLQILCRKGAIAYPYHMEKPDEPVLYYLLALPVNSSLSIHKENRTAATKVPIAAIVAINAIFFSQVTRLNIKNKSTGSILA